MNTYKRRRFPPEVISYAVWLYHRFNLSCRDVEDLLAERRITVSYETISRMQEEAPMPKSNRTHHIAIGVALFFLVLLLFWMLPLA